jgi:hypothetical protein
MSPAHDGLPPAVEHQGPGPRHCLPRLWPLIVTRVDARMDARAVSVDARMVSVDPRRSWGT